MCSGAAVALGSGRANGGAWVGKASGESLDFLLRQNLAPRGDALDTTTKKVAGDGLERQFDRRVFHRECRTDIAGMLFAMPYPNGDLDARIFADDICWSQGTGTLAWL